MADEDAEDVEKGTDNGADGGADELTAEDWKAKYEEAIKHSREWEKRAKANKNAARTLDDANAAAKNAEDALAEAEKRRTLKANSPTTSIPPRLRLSRPLCQLRLAFQPDYSKVKPKTI